MAQSKENTNNSARSKAAAAAQSTGAPAAQTGEKRPRTTRRPYYNRRPRRPQQPREAAVPIHIYPLGGLGEVGKNMTVYECNGDMIIVDCGLVFPDSDMYGVDMVIPDFTFVVQNKDKIKGLLITHGHEDHIGSIPYLLQKLDLPIYGTRLTCGLIRNKLEEFGLAGRTKFVEITPRQKIRSKEAAADFHEAETVAAAKDLAAKIEGKTVTIKAKGGASGRLHGKVTGKEVADALAQLAGAPIDKKKIELETKDIKDAGVFNGKVRLHVGVVASFKIMVEVEQA